MILEKWRKNEMQYITNSSSAADIIKIAMINASNKLESENWKSENTFFANYVNWF
jgi:hypothetical protein